MTPAADTTESGVARGSSVGVLSVSEGEGGSG